MTHPDLCVNTLGRIALYAGMPVCSSVADPDPPPWQGAEGAGSPPICASYMEPRGRRVPQTSMYTINVCVVPTGAGVRARSCQARPCLSQ
jgi:hypothetical protein